MIVESSKFVKFERVRRAIEIQRDSKERLEIVKDILQNLAISIGTSIRLCFTQMWTCMCPGEREEILPKSIKKPAKFKLQMRQDENLISKSVLKLRGKKLKGG